MRRIQTQSAWASLETLWAAGTLGTLTDGELLDHFQHSPGSTGQEAFRVLVERHGAMVLGVCRALVGDPHEAEDAFQATFLVLVRRTDAIRQRETIAPWLYGVACRVARKARKRASRRRRREVAIAIDPPARSDAGEEVAAESQALQEEIRRLPESLRAPLILCCLEGQSYDLASRRLGVKESTLRGRLHRARKLLETRLQRRGMLVPIVARLVSPERFAVPSVPLTLVEATTHLAVRWSSLSGLLVATATGSAASLAKGVLNAMFLQSAKVCGLAVVLVGGTIGTMVVAQQSKSGSGVGETPTAEARQVAPKAEPKEMKRLQLDRKTELIRQKLAETIDLDLPPNPTFDQFLKTIKRATTTADFNGIPIYVDPLGLQRSGVGINDPIEVYKSPHLGTCLDQTLRLLRLSCIVKDGFLMISSHDFIVEEKLDMLDRKLDRLLKAVERSEEPEVIGVPLPRVRPRHEPRSE